MPWQNGLPEGLREEVETSPHLTDEERAQLNVESLRAFDALNLLHLLQEAREAEATLVRVRRFVEQLV
jgi:hypothetical protein